MALAKMGKSVTAAVTDELPNLMKQIVEPFDRTTCGVPDVPAPVPSDMVWVAPSVNEIVGPGVNGD